MVVRETEENLLCPLLPANFLGLAPQINLGLPQPAINYLYFLPIHSFSQSLPHCLLGSKTGSKMKVVPFLFPTVVYLLRSIDAGQEPTIPPLHCFFNSRHLNQINTRANYQQLPPLTRASISRTALSSPTKTAREMMVWPMFNSSIPLIAATLRTF